MCLVLSHRHASCISNKGSIQYTRSRTGIGEFCPGIYFVPVLGLDYQVDWEVYRSGLKPPEPLPQWGLSECNPTIPTKSAMRLYFNARDDKKEGEPLWSFSSRIARNPISLHRVGFKSFPYVWSPGVQEQTTRPDRGTFRPCKKRLKEKVTFH